jgi:hypothetical protein
LVDHLAFVCFDGTCSSRVQREEACEVIDEFPEDNEESNLKRGRKAIYLVPF